MLLRTARAAPRLLRTAHRHKASSVAALHDDDDATTRATIAKVVSRYARTQEQLVPWFLEQMPRSYFALVPESSQLAHLQAAAGLFDPARGFDVLDEVRAASADDGTVTYLTSGNAPGTLARQVRTLAGQGELTGLKVFTSRDETLCLNVFNFDTAAPDSCFEAEDALAPHLQYARAKGGEGFWSEAAVRAHADKCSLDYQLGTRPAHWARQRALFERVAGSDAVAARVDASNGSAWLTVVAPNTLPASFLHKVLRLVAAHSLDVKLAEMDTVEDCLILRVLVTGSANWTDVAAVSERLKWLGETSLVPLFAKGAPTARDATLLEVRYALETLAQRTLGCSRDRVTTVLKRHGDLADAAARLLLKRPVGRGDGGDVTELLASVDAVSDEEEKIILAEAVRHATTCLQTNVGRADRQALALVLDPKMIAQDTAEVPARVVFVAGRRFDAFHVSMRPVARGGVRLVTPKTPEALANAAAKHYDECRDLAQAQQ
jgi:glutamate dehydrogenase